MITFQIVLTADNVSHALAMRADLLAAGIDCQPTIAQTQSSPTRGGHGPNMLAALEFFQTSRLRPTIEERQAGLSGEALAIHRLQQAGQGALVVDVPAVAMGEPAPQVETVGLEEGEEY